MISAKLFTIQISPNIGKIIYLKEKYFKFFTPQEIKQIFEFHRYIKIKNNTLKVIKETLRIITARKNVENFIMKMVMHL